MGNTDETVNPAANPSHPGHASWIAKIANGLLETGILILSGGRVQVGDDQVSIDSNPIEHGNVIDIQKK